MSESGLGDGQGITAEKFIEKLRGALKKEGDFPASAKIVNELRMLTSDPRTTANQITEVILRDPSLPTRILSLVNSSFYQRAKPIMTVSQAVIQIGMKPLSEMCAGLILLKKFVPTAKQGGPLADCLQRTILTSVLSSSITTELHRSGSKRVQSRVEETGYLTGTFAEIGTLLLAYYFPQLYKAAEQRSIQKKQPLSVSIQQLTGMSLVAISVEVIDALELPAFYKDILLEADALNKGQPSQPGGNAMASGALFAARNVTEVIVENQGKEALDRCLSRITNIVKVPSEQLDRVMEQLPEIFEQHCGSLDLRLPSLPDYVSTPAGEAAPEEAEAQSGVEDNFTRFVDEIRESVANKEPTASIITTVMETFAWSLKFDRVVLLLATPAKNMLIGRMALGQLQDFDPKSIQRALDRNASPYAPDLIAFKEGRPVFNGDPIFEDGWPFTATPIGFGERAIGVIYADRVGSDSELSNREQAAIGVLAELLDRSISQNS